MAQAPVKITPATKKPLSTQPPAPQGSDTATSDINGKHLEIHMMLTRNSPAGEVEHVHVYPPNADGQRIEVAVKGEVVSPFVGAEPQLEQLNKVELRKCYHCGHFTQAITVCGVCGMR